MTAIAPKNIPLQLELQRRFGILNVTFFHLGTSHLRLAFSHFHFLFMSLDYILFIMSVSTSCICLLSAHLCSSSYQSRCKSVPASPFIGSSAPTALMFFFSCSPVLMCPLCLWFVPRGFIVCPPLFSLLPFWCSRIGFRDLSFVTEAPFYVFLPASVCLALGSLFDHT